MTTVHIYKHGTQKKRYMVTKKPIPTGASQQPQLATPNIAGAEWHAIAQMELDRMVVSEPERERIGSEIDRDGYSFFISDREVVIGL